MEKRLQMVFAAGFLALLFCLAAGPVFAADAGEDKKAETAALEAKKQAAEEAMAKTQKEAEARVERAGPEGK